MATPNWILINYSSNNTLTTIVESIEKQLDARNYTAGVPNDLKRLLTWWITTFYLRNLIIYYGVAKNWFESYLNSQKQYVILNGSDSSLKLVSTGAPQESVLRSLLFLVYINALCKCVKYFKVYHFADDTNMLQSDSSLKNVAKRLNFNKKINKLKINKLSLNVTKTKIFIFHSNSRKIDRNLKLSWMGNIWPQLAQ